SAEKGGGMPPAAPPPAGGVFVRIEPLRIEDRAEGLRIRSPAHARAFVRHTEIAERHAQLALQSVPAEIDFGAPSVQALSVGIREAPRALRQIALDGSRV